MLCSARSYSSVVTAMLGLHPDLYGFPELKLFAYPTVGELAASLPEDARRRGIAHRSPGLVRAIAELRFGGQTTAALARASAWLAERAHWPGEDVFDLLLESVRPREGVEKSPEHAADSQALERLARAYPAGRFVHLTRHPVATIESMHEHLSRRLPGYDRIDLVNDCVAEWLETTARILDFGRGLPPGRFLRLRAEDVLDRPVPALTRLAHSLALRADESAIAAMLHPERSPYAGFAPRESGVPGGSDPSFLADPRLRPRRPRGAEPPGWWSLSVAQQADLARAGEALGYRPSHL